MGVVPPAGGMDGSVVHSECSKSWEQTGPAGLPSVCWRRVAPSPQIPVLSGHCHPLP